MPHKNEQFTFNELKQIILGLRMSTLSFVEEGAISEIQSMIKSLPSPEELEKSFDDIESIKRLQNDIGGIMRLIEIYGKKDAEYNVRYKSRTGLPPRYKILELGGEVKNKSGSNKGSETLKIAGLSDFWQAGKEAYYYRYLMNSLSKDVEKFGNLADKLYPIIGQIKNPDFKEKIDNTMKRLLYIQDKTANLVEYMNGNVKELSDAGNNAEGSLREQAVVGGQVTFQDHNQYTVEQNSSGEKVINVGGVEYKINEDSNGRVNTFQATNTNVVARDNAKKSWQQYGGVDFDAEIDSITRAINGLDLSKLDATKLDSLLQKVTEIQSRMNPEVLKSEAPVFSVAASNRNIRTSAAIDDIRNKWDAIGGKGYYDGKVKKLMSNIWNGKIKDINLEDLKEVIGKVKAEVAKGGTKAPPPPPSPSKPPVIPPTGGAKGSVPPTGGPKSPGSASLVGKPSAISPKPTPVSAPSGKTSTPTEPPPAGKPSSPPTPPAPKPHGLTPPDWLKDHIGKVINVNLNGTVHRAEIIDKVEGSADGLVVVCVIKDDTGGENNGKEVNVLLETLEKSFGKPKTSSSFNWKKHSLRKT